MTTNMVSDFNSSVMVSSYRWWIPEFDKCNFYFAMVLKSLLVCIIWNSGPVDVYVGVRNRGSAVIWPDLKT